LSAKTDVSGKTVMTWDARSKQRLHRQRTAEVAELLYYKKKLNLRVVPTSEDISAEQLARLEAENSELRCRAAELALEIHSLGAGNARFPAYDE
jgi:hypothetical protein